MRRAPLLALALLALSCLWAPSARADFGFSLLDGGVFAEGGEPVTQAGAHPFELETELAMNFIVNPPGSEPPESPEEALEDLSVDLPPGLIGDPTAVQTCPFALFYNPPFEDGGSCPADSVLGFAEVVYDDLSISQSVTVHNLVPSPGHAAKIGFSVLGFPIVLEAGLSRQPPYHVTVRLTDAYQAAPFFSSQLDVWGVPADPAHDAERGGPAGVEPKPFLSMPTACGAAGRVEIAASSWEGSSDSGSFPLLQGGGELDGCEQLDFEPSFAARPTTNVADQPSGLEVELEVPQNEGACEEGPPLDCGLATPHLRDALVTLPEGLVVNPSGANGLAACSPAQIGLHSAPGVSPPDFGPDRPACPEEAKLATVSAETPLLDHPLRGAAYVATPHDNPFGSLLAIYIVLDDPETGTLVKLAGEVRPDPVTGRLQSSFEDNPQAPVSKISLSFFGGPGAALRTPALCGEYVTTATLTPWSAPGSGPAATTADPWRISQAPGGGHCAGSAGELPHSPGFDAGAVVPVAGAHSPFVVRLSRPDGSQAFSRVTLRPPPGLVAELAAVPYCPDAALAAAAARPGRDEQASPSCPAASAIGSVLTAAGAGPAPFHAPGAAYLTGPYKGAPLSMAVVAPAVAGPFDLGVVVVRVALYVNPRTAEITAVSDPLPQILQGIPLDIRSTTVTLDKPNFTLNPTSCEAMAVGGELLSSGGAVAPLFKHFQLGGCGRLGFKPRIALHLKGGTRRGAHPMLTAVLRPRPGDANIASLSLAMPRSEFLDQANIRTVCTRVQFVADACPKGAVYGRARVQTPILGYPLAGPLYLRSSDNLLPDLVPDLRGPAYQPLRVEAAGRTDSVKGALRNTFDFVPDAPFTKLVARLRGGKRGLLVNSRNICRRTYRAKVRYTAHNGRTYKARPKLRTRCGKRAKKRNRGGHRRTP